MEPAHVGGAGAGGEKEFVPPRGDRGIRTTNAVLLILAAIVTVFFLREARLVFIPLALAAFLTMLVWPVRAGLSRRLPDWAAATLTMVMVLAVCSLLGLGLWLVGSRVAGQFDGAYQRLLDQYQNILAWWQARGLPIEWLSAAAGEGAQGTDTGAAPNSDGGEGGAGGAGSLSAQTTRQLMAFLTSGLGTALGIFAVLGLTAALTALLLLELPRWRDRLEDIFGPERYAQTADSLARSAQQFRRYLLAQTISGLAAGLLTWLLCLSMGVPLALVWGILSWLFNYIPNVGIFFSGLPPTLLAFATLSPGSALLVLAGLAAIEMVTANLIAPLFEGGTMILSPFEALTALIFWGWMWGIAGALLSVPITAALVVVLRHIDRLRPLGKFLSD